jgi:small subunit ribosomal protein S19e
MLHNMSQVMRNQHKLKLIQHENLISALAQKIKSDCPQVKPPSWAPFVKTCPTNFEPPKSTDWWYTRAASLMRKMAIKGTMGLRDFRLQYGGKRRSGARPEKSRMAAGGHLRRILIQLESAKLVQKDKKGGRTLTKEGLAFIDSTVDSIIQKTLDQNSHLKLYVGE